MGVRDHTENRNLPTTQPGGHVPLAATASIWHHLFNHPPHRSHPTHPPTQIAPPQKHLRLQEIAQQCRLPCVYLVDSGGCFLHLFIIVLSMGWFEGPAGSAGCPACTLWIWVGVQLLCKLSIILPAGTVGGCFGGLQGSAAVSSVLRLLQQRRAAQVWTDLMRRECVQCVYT